MQGRKTEAESRDGLPVAGPKKYRRRKTEAAWKTVKKEGESPVGREQGRAGRRVRAGPRAGGDEIRSLQRTRVWKTNQEGETNCFFNQR
jgi:hypothetical protein